MITFKQNGFLKYTIDFPMEFTPEELSENAHPINTLLRNSYLIGGSFNAEESVNFAFDISEEIAGVELCGFLIPVESSVGTWDLKVSRRLTLRTEDPDNFCAPAAIAAYYGKGVFLKKKSGDIAASICDAWGARSLLAFPIRRDRDVTGVFVFGKKDHQPFTKVQTKLLWGLSVQAETHLYHLEPVFALSYYSIIDQLTHLYNRQYFDSQLGKEILRSRRSGSNFCLILFGIDGFTEYKNRFSSGCGDIVLQEFSDIMRKTLREVDTLARIGSDEFGVILLESTPEGAHTLADRVIDRFHKHLLPGSNNARSERLSVSVGIAAFPFDAFDFVDLVSKAGVALELARNYGGGQAREFHETSEHSRKGSLASDLPIRKIYDAGRSVVDMDKFLEILLFTGMQSISACRGSIVVKSPEGKNFLLNAAVGFKRNGDPLAGSAISSPGVITSWVLNHELPLVVSRTEDSPIPLNIRKNVYQADSFISIPLSHMGKTLGALNFTHKKDGQQFTREDLHILSPIAVKIASILSEGIVFRENMRQFSLSILSSLKDALELRYPFLYGHSSRVRDLAIQTGKHMGLEKRDLEALEYAALLHDVGIVGIPSDILSKKQTLNDREMEMVKKHPFLGAKLMEGAPGMESTKRTVLEHHENFNGSGYPNGLHGKDICLTARILGVTECYDSVISERPHRGKVDSDAAIQLIRDNKGLLFDPEVVSAFEKVVHQGFN